MVKIPSRLEELLPLSAFERVMDSLHRPELSQKVREAIGRVGLKEVNPLEQVQEAWKQARSWLASIAGESAQGSGQVINATGSLFLDEFGSMPTISSISLSHARGSVSFQDRDQVLRRANEVVQQTLGAKHHVWLSDSAAALNAVVQSISPQGVLIPRSDNVRIPGFGDVHAMLSAVSPALIEVGANNGVSKYEWDRVLADGAHKSVVIVSPNSLSAQAAATNRSDLLESAHSSNVPIVEILIDGTVDRNLSQQYGFPLLQQRLEREHLVLLPTHLLLGAIRGVLCIGSESQIEAISRRASLLGCLLDSAAISANLLALQIGTLDDDLERGVIGGLRTNSENLRNRSQRLAIQLSGVGPVLEATVLDFDHPLGPSPWDRYRVHGPIIRLRTNNSSQAIVDRLRDGSPEVPAVTLSKHGDDLHIDLRFVNPDDDHHIAAAFA